MIREARMGRALEPRAACRCQEIASSVRTPGAVSLAPLKTRTTIPTSLGGVCALRVALARRSHSMRCRCDGLAVTHDLGKA